MEKELPENDEKIAGFRKLLEAKDCFVRAKLNKRKNQYYVKMERIPKSSSL